MKARQIVEEMDSYVPGKSQDEIASDFNLKKEDIIKLGSNENPWGPSSKAMEAIKNEINSINRYPESQLHELVSEIAKYSDVKDSQVIGDVELGEDVSIWHGAVVRGDTDSITIGDNSNVQDNCVVHCTKGFPVEIGKNVSVGHGAVVHGCKLDDNVLIGMNATVLNGAHISKNSIVGAGAVVSEGKEFPEGSLILGIPAKAVKEVTPQQIEMIQNNADNYVKLSKQYKED